ncbi:hypothetical protein PC116_g17421 [Phytophthora cactorum]|nr:hypothetical protein PC116_g17421 [Phytophthora cactorum]
MLDNLSDLLGESEQQYSVQLCRESSLRKAGTKKEMDSSYIVSDLRRANRSPRFAVSTGRAWRSVTCRYPDETYQVYKLRTSNSIRDRNRETRNRAARTGRDLTCTTEACSSTQERSSVRMVGALKPRKRRPHETHLSGSWLHGAPRYSSKPRRQRRLHYYEREFDRYLQAIQVLCKTKPAFYE